MTTANQDPRPRDGSEHAHHLAELIRLQFVLTDFVPHIYRLLAAGEPITVEQLAAAGGWSTADVRAEAARNPGMDWDDAGRIAGFGLTLRPTPHRFTFDGRTVYAFCASDALLFPVILERPGVIESTCPGTGQSIRVEVSPDTATSIDPPQAVVSRIRPDHAVADIRAEICAPGNFFSSPHAATDWLTANPNGEVVPLADDFATTRRAATELGWTTTRR